MASILSSSSTIAAVMTVALVLLAGGGRVAEAQGADCASKLIPCADYLGKTNPSKECCDAMKTVVTTQLPCLCGLLKNPTQLGINITQALDLPKHCNIPSDTSACNAAEAPRSSSLSPPATAGGKDGNAAGTSSRMGMCALVLVSAFTFLY